MNTPAPPPFPFTAIVGQDELRLALLLNAIDPLTGGVLIRGERGTAKSTAARALAALLPPLDGAGSQAAPPPFVELPLGATEDRVIGTLDLEPALREGRRRLRPGLLAQADGGVLYVDEVNLLPDHLVDLLLDSAASGCVRVERDGLSESAPARFILVGSMNPEEGELRPQFLDRFGLCVHVTTPADNTLRVETLRRRLAYDADPGAFVAAAQPDTLQLRARVADARARLRTVPLDDDALAQAASLCASLKLDGARGDLTLVRAARALAAWENAAAITDAHIRRAARLALPHRRRKKPFEPVNMDPPPAPPDAAAPQRREQDDAAAAPPGSARVPPVPLSGEDAGQSPRDAGAPQTAPAPDLSSCSSGVHAAPAGTIHLAIDAPPPTHAATGRRDSASQPAGGVIGSAPLREGGSLAVAPTLTAAALRMASDPAAQSGGGGMPLPPVSAPALHRSDLRQHERAKRGAARVLFIVDASGSMSAQHRLALAKGAATGLLAGSYQKRDEAGLMIFRGESAALLAPFTRDVGRVEHALRDVPTGGRTPLAAALAEAAALLAVHGPALLVVFTDGRANVPLRPGGNPWRDALAAARDLAPAAAGALVVDCETGPVALGRARDLAAALAAECEHLSALDEPSLTLRIRNQLAA